MSRPPALNEISVQFSPGQQVTAGKWFGKPCLKVSGKVFAALWGEDMAVKLTAEAHAEALRVPGAHPFDPRGQGHAMREWVQIPAAQSSTWVHFARLACEFVAGAAQAAKDELIHDLVQARRKVLDAASRLTPQQQDAIFLGDWSARDLLAHLAGWDDANRQAVQEILAGQKPSFLQYRDRDWKSYNARLVAHYRRDSWSELLEVVESSLRHLLDLLQAIPAEDYVNHRRIARLIRADAKDVEEHARQLDDFRAAQSAAERGALPG
jgi:hypothetical protein